MALHREANNRKRQRPQRLSKGGCVSFDGAFLPANDPRSCSPSTVPAVGLLIVLSSPSPSSPWSTASRHHHLLPLAVDLVRRLSHRSPLVRLHFILGPNCSLTDPELAVLGDRLSRLDAAAAAPGLEAVHVHVAPAIRLPPFDPRAAPSPPQSLLPLPPGSAESRTLTKALLTRWVPPELDRIADVAIVPSRPEAYPAEVEAVSVWLCARLALSVSRKFPPRMTLLLPAYENGREGGGGNKGGISGGACEDGALEIARGAAAAFESAAVTYAAAVGLKALPSVDCGGDARGRGDCGDGARGPDGRLRASEHAADTSRAVVEHSRRRSSPVVIQLPRPLPVPSELQALPPPRISGLYHPSPYDPDFRPEFAAQLRFWSHPSYDPRSGSGSGGRPPGPSPHLHPPQGFITVSGANQFRRSMDDGRFPAQAMSPARVQLLRPASGDAPVLVARLACGVDIRVLTVLNPGPRPSPPSLSPSPSPVPIPARARPVLRVVISDSPYRLPPQPHLCQPVAEPAAKPTSTSALGAPPLAPVPATTPTPAPAPVLALKPTAPLRLRPRPASEAVSKRVAAVPPSLIPGRRPPAPPPKAVTAVGSRVESKAQPNVAQQQLLPPLRLGSQLGLELGLGLGLGLALGVGSKLEPGLNAGFGDHAGQKGAPLYRRRPDELEALAVSAGPPRTTLPAPHAPPSPPLPPFPPRPRSASATSASIAVPPAASGFDFEADLEGRRGEEEASAGSTPKRSRSCCSTNSRRGRFNLPSSPGSCMSLDTMSVYSASTAASRVPSLIASRPPLPPSRLSISMSSSSPLAAAVAVTAKRPRADEIRQLLEQRRERTQEALRRTAVALEKAVESGGGAASVSVSISLMEAERKRKRELKGPVPLVRTAKIAAPGLARTAAAAV